jgi:hypothetical protein
MANQDDGLTPEQLAKAIEAERHALLMAGYARADINMTVIDVYQYKAFRKLVDVAVRLDMLAAGIRKSPNASRATVLGMLRKRLYWGGAKRPWRLLSKQQLHCATLYLGEFMAEATDKIAKQRKLRLVSAERDSN